MYSPERGRCGEWLTNFLDNCVDGGVVSEMGDCRAW